MKKVFLTFVFALLSVVGFAQTGWQVDPMHSSVNFTIKHMGISFVQGRFDKFDGKAVTKGNTLANAELSFNVDVSSINTGVEMRDKHLKSPDFFDAEKFPYMSFVTGSVVKGENGTYIFKGKLTIKDITKEVSVPVTFGGITKNQQGKEVMGFQTAFKVNRLDYNIKYDPTGAGVAKDVDVNLYFEMVKQ
ncbi:polyisoprenoid-binding protein [Chryseobacterium shandongense]|uniref:Polyisoprenoid-binding protein n=1 Tax=Chryseobacterium shandongense TaxID=1493872 RepID=A0A3G6Q5X7_9FLAO|nr:YceI family protein [Chryseobacterium shandongense]AZA56214.1 polyisoprenoid-binding protein [Chryseobacterium shandongense]AZA88124.1 polyisoprenoid-binding protein [Chryseobacterium shandongense]AZA96685.1 polyisoprenoid-binding protein [Chryseobacterium shandongense]